MAENEPQAAPERRTTRAAAKDAPTESEAVKTDDERYVGVDPIYKQSAYEEPLEPEAGVTGEGTAEEKQAQKEANEAELEMIERVKENEAGNKVEVDEPVPFEEWLPESGVAARHLSVRGRDEEQAEADAEATEAAKNEKGRISPRSTAAGQPGVRTAP